MERFVFSICASALSAVNGVPRFFKLDYSLVLTLFLW